MFTLVVLRNKERWIMFMLLLQVWKSGLFGENPK